MDWLKRILGIAARNAVSKSTARSNEDELLRVRKVKAARQAAAAEPLAALQARRLATKSET